MAGSHPLTHTQVNPTDIGSKQTDITCQNGSLKLERHYRFSGAREWISYPFSVHRGIAMSGSNTTLPGIIQLGGVVRFGVS